MVTVRCLMYAIVVCATLSSAFAQPISRPTEYIPQHFDVLHYELDATIRTPATKEIVGVVAMVVRWNQATSSTTLPFHLRGLEVDSVVSAGMRLATSQQSVASSDTFHYKIDVNWPTAVDVVDTFHIYYHGSMTTEGGFSAWGGVWYEDQTLYALGVGFANPNVSATQHWMPCYDHPSDKASFKATFWVPQSLTVASNGVKSAVLDVSNDTLRGHVWEESHPTATYLLTFAVGPYVELDLGNVRGTPQVVYTRTRDTAVSRSTYKLLHQMVELFSDLYGEYPFDKVGYAHTTRGAMEHQTMISMPTSSVQRGDTTNTIVAHELAHQWFGDCVSPLDFRHAWLTESFATYSESAWLEHVLGRDAYLESLETTAGNYINTISQREGVMSLYDYPRAAPSSNYPETIYQKGRLVLAMARMIAGDEAFYSALRGYIQTFRYGTATTLGMRDALQAALGELTDDFINQWVEQKGWPKLRVTLSSEQAQWFATIEQTQKETHPEWPVFTALPINITYQSPTTLELIDTVVIMTSKEMRIPIASPDRFHVNGGTKGRSLLEIVSITSVHNAFSKAPTITVHPNPADDTATINRKGTHDDARVSIVDMKGAELVVVHIPYGVSSQSIDISTLPAGMYMVRIVGEESVTSLPLQVVR